MRAFGCVRNHLRHRQDSRLCGNKSRNQNRRRHKRICNRREPYHPRHFPLAERHYDYCAHTVYPRIYDYIQRTRRNPKRNQLQEIRLRHFQRGAHRIRCHCIIRNHRYDEPVFDRKGIILHARPWTFRKRSFGFHFGCFLHKTAQET